MSGASPLPLPSRQAVLNGMSVDVEDWFQVGAFEHVIQRGDWDGLDRRVEANCDRILRIFADADVKATFFTLGWVAERHPAQHRPVSVGLSAVARARPRVAASMHWQVQFR